MPVVRQLQRALNCDRVVFTSPAAVTATATLLPLAKAQRSPWLTVGEGTARALREHGVAGVHAPQRMDSEGCWRCRCWRTSAACASDWSPRPADAA